MWYAAAAGGPVANVPRDLVFEVGEGGRHLSCTVVLAVGVARPSSAAAPPPPCRVLRSLLLALRAATARPRASTSALRLARQPAAPLLPRSPAHARPYTHAATPPPAVQHEAIPQALLGMDVLCQAKSGMGKTAVFVLTTLNQLVAKEGEVSVLVLCHTRELAYQIGNEYNRFAKYMPGVKCVSSVSC